jgi:hypothetical protein
MLRILAIVILGALVLSPGEYAFAGKGHKDAMSGAVMCPAHTCAPSGARKAREDVRRCSANNCKKN